MPVSWIPLESVDPIVSAEPLFLLLALAASCWIFYRLFLKGVSPERHRNLRRLFQNLLLHSVNTIVLVVGFQLLRHVSDPAPAMARLIPYVGFAAILWGSTVLVKTVRILSLEYLFLTSMRAGVPLLLVNLLSLLMSVVIATWILSGIFHVQLMPLLATSAIFSVVLGLAVQDTLGNLIAGVALQIDKPYEIGDWIEVNNGLQKWIGQVNEISWRSTILIATTEESITIPNRIMANAEVSNFAAKVRPFIRGQIFRIGFSEPREKVKAALLAAAAEVPSVRQYPAPMVLMMETTESWIAYKLIYYVDDYGRQFITGDEVIGRAMAHLEKAKIEIAPTRLAVEKSA